MTYKDFRGNTGKFSWVGKPPHRGKKAGALHPSAKAKRKGRIPAKSRGIRTRPRPAAKDKRKGRNSKWFPKGTLRTRPRPAATPSRATGRQSPSDYQPAGRGSPLDPIEELSSFDLLPNPSTQDSPTWHCPKCQNGDRNYCQLAKCIHRRRDIHAKLHCSVCSSYFVQVRARRRCLSILERLRDCEASFLK